MISLQGVYQRAEELGRSISGKAPSSAPAPTPKPPARHMSQTQSEPEAEAPPGTTLVPLDAWNKMLLQLGNLHEAGQQLAEASARAAKAETEAAFLKERLAELREELARAREQSPKSSAPRPAAPPQPASAATSVIRQIYNSWRGRSRS